MRFVTRAAFALVVFVTLACKEKEIAKPPAKTPEAPPVTIPRPRVEAPPVAVTSPAPGSFKEAGPGGGVGKSFGDSDIEVARLKLESPGFLKPVVCEGETYRVESKLEAGLFAEGCLGEDAEGRVVPTQRWKISYANGLLHSVQEYDRGVRIGAWRRWDTAGYPLLTAHFRADKLHGKFTYAGWPRSGVRNAIDATFRRGLIENLRKNDWAPQTVRTIEGERRLEVHDFRPSDPPVVFSVKITGESILQQQTVDDFLGRISAADLAKLAHHADFFAKNSGGSTIVFHLAKEKYELGMKDYAGWSGAGHRIREDLFGSKEKIDFQRAHLASWLRENPSRVAAKWLFWMEDEIAALANQYFIPMRELTR